jgi:chemotaxis protein MotA
MNLSAPLGFLIGLSVVYFAITQGMKNIAVFMDVHAIIIVIGGTLAAAMVCIPFSQLFNMVRLFFRTVTGAQKEEVLNCINEIVEISRKSNEGAPLKELIGNTKNPFLKESLELLSQGGLSQDEFEDVLEMRVEQQNERYKRQGSTFKIIGKFPPAFGLIGATLGMIALLQGLGEPDAFNRLGPAMSVALVATFYGLILANVFIIPIGENLMHASEDDLVMRHVVMDGVKLIRDSKHPLLVEEYLKSYLTPKDRNGMKKAA